jgi:hypothetical protein
MSRWGGRGRKEGDEGGGWEERGEEVEGGGNDDLKVNFDIGDRRDGKENGQTIIIYIFIWKNLDCFKSLAAVS